MKGLVYVLAGVVAVALTAGLVVGSAIPYTDDPGDGSLIRLSWRAVGKPVEQCREPTEEELAALPLHMRRGEICEAKLAPFRLAVAIDGEAVFEGQIRPEGARGDRPAYVLQEFPVAPGRHRLHVTFEAESGADAPAVARTMLTFDESVTLAPRDILLVTHESESDRLVATNPR